MGKRSVFLLAIVSLVFGACSNDEITANNKKLFRKDSAASGLGLFEVSDGGVAAQEAGSGLTTPANDLCDGTKIGNKCASDAECADNMECLVLSEDGVTGVCSCKTACIIANDKTGEMDDCPLGTVCTSVNVSETETKNVCMKRCNPQIGKNDCAPGISCDPFVSEDIFGLWQEFVCSGFVCKDNMECAVTSSTTCKVDDDCTKIKAGSKCLAVSATVKYCAMPGKCDPISGLCDKPTSVGDASKTIGSPCKSTWDCAAGHVCMKESPKPSLGATGAACTKDAACCSGKCDTSTKKCTEGVCRAKTRNGYCTIVGCNAEASLSTAQCGPDAICNHYFTYGRCFKKCDVTKAQDCRGQASIDKLGDYECLDWSGINKSIATGATCEQATISTCAELGKLMNSTDPCARLAPKGNPKNMKCRLLNNTEASSKVSASGFCLDDSASSLTLAP